MGITPTAKCAHCYLETNHPVTKHIGGRELFFCCHGCAQVYAFLFQEGLLPHVEEEEEKSNEKK